MEQEPLANTWNTHEHIYKGHKILVKTRRLGGKVHIWGNKWRESHKNV